MIDARNVFFPMTAGDLVASACIAAFDKRGDGIDVRLLEVVDVDAAEPGQLLRITVRDRVSHEHGELVFAKATPILICEISRT